MTDQPSPPVAPSATSTAPTKPSRNVAVLAKWVVIALAIGVVVDLVGVASGIGELSLLHQAVVTMDEATANDNRQGAIGIAQLVMLFVTAVLFIMWLRRATVVARRHATAPLPYGPGWAVGGWFVPFLNLVRPFQVVRQAERVAQDGNPKRGDASGVTAIWWFVWIVINFVGQAAFRLGVSADGMDELRTASSVSLASDVGSILAGVLAIIVVRRVTEGLRLRATGTGGVSSDVSVT